MTNGNLLLYFTYLWSHHVRRLSRTFINNVYKLFIFLNEKKSVYKRFIIIFQRLLHLRSAPWMGELDDAVALLSRIETDLQRFLLLPLRRIGLNFSDLQGGSNMLASTERTQISKRL